ncbi:MAG: HAD family phosphatase [Verrucomicrobiales bacterium]|jgi:putative hydrolase of the HAD superfamily|nr:HAD family phosphatase [Verrucomicrobiales bacterium]
MSKQPHINTLFTDIGGVLLNNGWDRKRRAITVEKFGLEGPEMDERHHLTFDTYEEGKISLDEYLDRVVFYKKRHFSRAAFKKFMFGLSEPYPEMINLIKSLKKKYGFRVAVVSNEGRELNDYRIQKFKLNSFVDFFISSSFVHIRKPDADIFKLALDIAQTRSGEVLYIDDRPMFVQVAQGLGIRGICHKDVASTKKQLAFHGWK